MPLSVKTSLSFVKDVKHRKEHAVKRPLAMLHENEVVDVRQRQLRWIAGINGAALGPRPEHLVVGVV